MRADKGVSFQCRLTADPCLAADISLGCVFVMFSAAVRIGLIVFGIDNLAVHFVLGVVAGVLGPLLVYVVARRFGVLGAVGLV